MRRRVIWISSIVIACSGAPPRSAAPPRPTSPAPVATPAAVAPTAPAMLVAADDPGFAFKDPNRLKTLLTAVPAIEKQIDDQMKKESLPGLAIGIVVDGALVYSKGFGVTSVETKAVPDADTVYRIGSITKSFTGLALLSLRDEGVLQLDDPLAKWIPEAHQLVYPSRDSARITLRQLANHTSGLPRMGPFPPEDGPTEDMVVRALDKLQLETTPGTNWKYSNLGFSLLGIAVGRAAKAPYHHVIAKRIIGPLGMASTGWAAETVPNGKLAPPHRPSPNGPTLAPTSARLGAADGAGGIYSSVRDMAKYVGLQMSAYPPRNADESGPFRRATLR
jgi:CubicO group peptidase (beta-lactamase class C family)